MLLLLALSSLPPSPPSTPSTAWHLADCDSGSEITAAADCQVRLPLVMLRSEHMLRSVANASSSGTTATPASTHPAPSCSPRLRLNHCGLVPCPRLTPAGNSPMLTSLCASDALPSCRPVPHSKGWATASRRSATTARPRVAPRHGTAAQSSSTRSRHRHVPATRPTTVSAC